MSNFTSILQPAVNFFLIFILPLTKSNKQKWVIKKASIRISCTNIRGLNSIGKLGIKMNHILKHLNSEIKIIVDSHADNTTIDSLKKNNKIKMSQYHIFGNESRIRGITVLVKKLCGYITANIKLLDKQNMVQFDLIAPDMTIYNIVAIYAPDSQEGADYWASLKLALETPIRS